MYTLENIEDILNLTDSQFKIIGKKENIQFNSFLPIDKANDDSLVWLSIENKNKEINIKNTKSKNIILDIKDISLITIAPEKNFIFVNNPKLVYQRIVKKLIYKNKLKNIHPTAIIHKKAKLGHNINIGPFTYIGEASIGDNVCIHGNVFIYDNVTIGNNVVIQAGTVIGSEGFGLTRNEKNELENFPHIGGVIIHDDCEIGANTTIDRGTLGNTILNNGCKIDNLIHIAHNVVIGKHTGVAANTVIAGSTIIGEYCWVAPSVSFRDRINIPSNSTIGIGAVVTKSIPKPDIYAGNPAKEMSQIIKINNFLNKNCE